MGVKKLTKNNRLCGQLNMIEREEDIFSNSFLFNYDADAERRELAEVEVAEKWVLTEGK